MKIFGNVIKIALLLSVLMAFSSCGYKPSAKYARSFLGEKISTNIKISSKDPENSVLIKDAIDSAILEVFHASITSRKQSQTHLQFSINSIKYLPLQYDTSGYVIAYRATIKLGIDKISMGETTKYATIGTYDFSVNPNAVITDQERFDAIKLSATKAIKSFISQISAQGAQSNKG